MVRVRALGGKASSPPHYNLLLTNWLQIEDLLGQQIFDL